MSDYRAPKPTEHEAAISSGVIGFAGAMLATVGVFQVLAAISALAKDDLFVAGQEYVYQLSVTSWGWIHLVIGGLAIAVGVCLLLGKPWAVLTGAGLAAIGAIVSFAWMPYYPWWSIVIIVFNVVVLWATVTQMNARDRR